MSYKCVVIGDKLAEKTEICNMYKPNKYPVVIDGKAQKLEMIDESGKNRNDDQNKASSNF